MAKRRKSASRSSVEWCIRIALATVSIWIGYGAAVHELGYLLRDHAPEKAYALSSHDGRILAALSQQLSGPNADPADRRRADALAHTALRMDPTAVAAVATLGIDAAIRGDTTLARRIFTYSQRLSRRDLRTNIWAIEDAVSRNDVTGAMRQYDITLRTSRIAPDLLFPVLASAISVADVRNAMVNTLILRPTWSDLFISYIAGNGEDPVMVAELFRALAGHGVTVSQGAQAAVVNRLVVSRKMEAAWAYYASVRNGVDRRKSRDPRFSDDISDPTPFDWVPVDTGGGMVAIQYSSKGGAVDIAIPVTMGGLLLRQLQWLPAGRYVLESHANGITQPAGSRPYWIVACSNGNPLAQIELPASADTKGLSSEEFTVPSDCPVQSLSLFARPVDDVNGLSGQIDMISLRPR